MRQSARTRACHANFAEASHPFRMSRTYGLRWAGAVLAGMGALPLLYACVLFAWQYAARITTGNWIALPAKVLFSAQTDALAPIAMLLPDLPAAWLGANPLIGWALERVHIGVPFALIGVLAMAIGVLTVLRQNQVLRREERLTADRLRRVRLGQYGELERREPYIGPAVPEIPERIRKVA